MRAFSLKSTVGAMATALALTAAAAVPAQARDPDWWARHHRAGYNIGSGGSGYGYGARDQYGHSYGDGYYRGGYFGGGSYDGGQYDDGFPFALGALGLMAGAAIAAERPYASVPSGCLVYHRIYNSRHHIIGHRWVNVCR